MRQLAMLLLGLALLLPAAATARPQGSGECLYLTNQIGFFQTRVERAHKLGNDLWEERLSAHVAALERRREDRCPGYGNGDQAMEALRRLIALAARGAVTFFTMGAF